MNIRRYILSLLLLCSCLAAMSAVSVPDVRSVVRQDGAVVESTDYYPYGTPFTTEGAVQPYKYGTKELDRMHGLDLYDSQARWYDSLTGRTSTLDPKAEKYYNLSPYTWCAGNLVRNIDEPSNVVWRETTNHRNNSNLATQKWDDYFNKNQSYTREDVLKKRDEIELEIFKNIKGDTPLKQLKHGNLLQSWR